MSKVRRWPDHLSGRDVIDTRIVTVRGTVVAFALNYRALIRDQWFPVLRYDTSHGHLHRHLYWRDIVEALEEPTTAGPPYNRELERAQTDLHENWAIYRRAMERTLGHRGGR